MRLVHRWMGVLLRRFPWLGGVVQRLYRVLQPQFSIGVIGGLPDAAGERVLLVEHVYHPRQPWGLPGGWLDRGEDPSQTVEREFQEEVGLHIWAVQPLVVHRSRLLRGHMDVIYLCALNGDGEQIITLDDELTGYRWASWDDLPPGMPSHAREAIRLALGREK
ncbi:MAG: NUDIX domain-containing protein [Chloroflexi bacterium]|nr:NUDIX domain-containing protein [Chloroflexota bacterium]